MVLNSTLTGSAGDDTLFFDNPNQVALVATGLAGNDSLGINFDSDGSEILGNEGNDTIEINLPTGVPADLASILNTTIRGGLGNDTIDISDDFNQIATTFINGNEGDDSVYINTIKSIVNSTIRGGDGNDTLDIQRIDSIQGALINGNAGNDTLNIGNVIGGTNGVINGSSIYGGAGDDSIYIDAGEISNSLVSGDTENDTIYIDADVFSSTIRGGDGNDTIYAYDSINNSSSVIGNLGNDSIYVYEVNSSSSVRGGDGNDSIYVYINNSLVNGNAGNDSIYVENNEGEVYGGLGNDSILATGDLNDFGSIIGNEGADTLQGAKFSQETFIYSFGDTALTGVVGFDSINNFVSNVIPSVQVNDVIDLTDTDLVFNLAGISGGITIDSDAVVTGGITSLVQFVEAGASLTTAGATLGISSASTGGAFGAGNFIFISNGDGVRDSEDLLIAFNTKVDEIQFSGGNIVGIT